MEVHEGNPTRMHPVLDAYLSTHECDRQQAQLAFRVYLDLSEVRGWREVELHYCSSCQLPYVSGRPSLSSQLEVAVPIMEDQSVSHHFIQSLFSQLTINEQSVDRIMLAICSSDTSLVYYKVTNDIVKPEPPEVTDVRRQEWALRAAKRKRNVAESIETFSQQQEGKPP